jgi:hypothetical protein
MIRIVLEVHLNAVVELEYDQPIGHNFASFNFRIHEVVETGLWPLAFLPMGNQFSVTEQVHGRLDGKTDVAKRELKVELPNTQLGRERPDDRRQVEFFGYSIHFSQSNDQREPPSGAAGGGGWASGCGSTFMAE